MSSIFLQGRFSKYARFFVEKKKDEEGSEYKIFPSYAELYSFCALYGCIKNTYCEYDPELNDESESKLETEIRGEYLKTTAFNHVRQIVLLNETISNRTDKEKIDAVFRHDYENDPIYNENSAIMHKYVLGGLEKIYNKFSSAKSKENVVKLLHDSIEEFCLDCKIISPKEITNPEFDDDYV